MMNHLWANIEALSMTEAGRAGPDSLAMFRHLGLAVSGAADNRRARTNLPG